MNAQLSKLMVGVDVQAVIGVRDPQITGVAFDSRRVRPGNIFVAIKGTSTDGHDYVGQAIERGAVAIVCERPAMLAPQLPIITVADARAALATIAANFYGRPSDQLKMIGITGTNGKTTTSFMVKHILESAGEQVGLLGTVRYEMGDRIISAGRTTPESLDIQELLASMVRSGCGACVMEVSSHALALKRVHGIDFDVAVFTNLTQDHLDFHGTMDDYFRAKAQLFTSLNESKKTARAVINIDDPRGETLALSVGGVLRHEGDAFCIGVECFTFGMSGRAVIAAEQIQTLRHGSQFVAVTPQGRVKIVLPLIGRHNIYNALAAIGVGAALDIELSVIAKALKTVPQVPGRLEAVASGQPFGVYVDYAHTDDALRNVMQALRQLPHERLITVFGCGGNRDSGKRPKMGRVADELSDYTVLTSDNPRKEDPRAIISQIQEGLNGKGNYEVVVDRRTAIARALSLAQEGDIVLIAGKGHETYQEFEDTIVPFDDKQVAQEFLKERKRLWKHCA
jgi:UDP-N-acetylmuramoyl-L-alanyl-D-glutamate--2,6-diaminopimelate ligase